jgi:hypothetical protein
MIFNVGSRFPIFDRPLSKQIFRHRTVKLCSNTMRPFDDHVVVRTSYLSDHRSVHTIWWRGGRIVIIFGTEGKNENPSTTRFHNQTDILLRIIRNYRFFFYILYRNNLLALIRITCQSSSHVMYCEYVFHPKVVDFVYVGIDIVTSVTSFQ